MIFFIRTENNKTIVDIEYFINSGNNNSYLEIKTYIDIEQYSYILLNSISKSDIDTKAIIEDFSMLQEIRGWLWENYFAGQQNTANKYEEVFKLLRKHIKGVANKYNLRYVED